MNGKPREPGRSLLSSIYHFVKTIPGLALCHHFCYQFRSSRLRLQFRSVLICHSCLHVLLPLLLSNGGTGPHREAASHRVHQRGPRRPCHSGQGSRPSSCGQHPEGEGRLQRSLVEAACFAVVLGCCLGILQGACWVGTCRALVHFAVDPSVPEEESWVAAQGASAGLAA